MAWLSSQRWYCSKGFKGVQHAVVVLLLLIPRPTRLVLPHFDPTPSLSPLLPPCLPPELAVVVLLTLIVSPTSPSFP